MEAGKGAESSASPEIQIVTCEEDAPAQDHSDVNELTCTKIRNWCRQIFNKISDNRPRITGEDGEARFWNKRARCGRLQLVFPLFTAFLFLTDVGLDCEIAVTHFKRGDTRWGAYTLGVVVLSLVINDVLSASFYLSDQGDRGKTEWLRKNNLHIRPWFYLFHCIFCGRLVRCFQIFKTVRLVRGIQTQHPDNIQRYRLYISQLQDLSILGVVEAFTEQAPQVGLQLYILLQKDVFDWSSSADIIVGINIVKSLALFSFSLLSFVRYLRLGSESSKLLDLFSWASFLHFTWRLFMLVARILALVLFANRFKHLVFIIVGIHFLFSFFLLRWQPDNYFPEGSAPDRLLRCAFTCINTFCFFPLAGKNTRKWAIPYYVVTFIENSIMVLVWNFYNDFGSVFKMIMLITEWVTFVIGLASMLLYYGVFHPSIKDCKNVEYQGVEEHTDGPQQFVSSI